MTVRHVVASLDHDQGGLARSVPTLATSLRDVGVDAIFEGEAPPDLLHIHGIWLPVHHAAAASGRRAGTPVVFSPRGMLHPWALSHRRWKKRLAWWLYQHRDLQGAAGIHATSDEEASYVRRLGLTAPIAVIPNGVHIPDPLPSRDRGEVRRALCLSRLHPVKGIPTLVEAWARVRPEGWELVIAGPDEDGHRSHIEARVTRAGLEREVSVRGRVDEEDKWALYRSADLYVLPTRSENFGLTIAEALGSGVPVLTTRGAPWSDIEACRCGWWAEIGASGVTAALERATSCSREELDAMGARGQSLVGARYAWRDIAVRTEAFYRWLIEGGDAPGFVDL